MSRSLGIPVKLLHEAAGHVVTVELKTGEVYRGSMIECEDNWNCQIENITFTAKDGKVSQLEHVFIRGSRVRFMIIPDMLKNAPMFKRLEARIRVRLIFLSVFFCFLFFRSIHILRPTDFASLLRAGQGVGHRRRAWPCCRDACPGCWWSWWWPPCWRR
uniref:Small nuclear ribonucleoprotein Sm D3 n=1 Tax=Aegilops tauschii subsp. strangulata TaxID=200361 RepID=A0A453JCU3_AEGTS